MSRRSGIAFLRDVLTRGGSELRLVRLDSGLWAVALKHAGHDDLFLYVCELTVQEAIVASPSVASAIKVRWSTVQRFIDAYQLVVDQTDEDGRPMTVRPA